MSVRALVVSGTVLGLVAVAAGAFGAHALEGRLDPDALAVFETGARYQMYHALALIGVGSLAVRSPDVLWGTAGWLFLAGVLVFSGSLYVLALTGVRWFGAVTPLGGLALLAGWGTTAAAAWRALG